MEERAPITVSTWAPVSPDTAQQAFLDLDEMRHWWGVASGLVDPRPGGVWTLGWEPSPQGFRYVSTGVIARYEPGSRLEIDRLVYVHPEHGIFGPMRLIVETAAERGGTRLTIRQDGYQRGANWDWYYEAVAAGWPAALDQLQRHLEQSRREAL